MKKFLLIAAFSVVAFAANLKAQYTTTNHISGLSNPVAFAFTPDGRILVTLKAGTIRIFNADGSTIGNFYSLTDSTFNDFERGLLGIEVDPDFATNHYVYAYYNHRFPNTSAGNTTQKLRVVRFTEVNNVGTNPTIILSLTPGYSIAGNHVGGNLRFRPSEPDKLYVTIGELAVPANAQLLTNPYGKFLRINTDGTIPTDNPFYDDGNPATGNDDRIWSYGHRNAFDFCFSTINDSLYSTENGQNTWDEMNIVTRRKNYGWNPCEGDFLNGSTTNPCTNVNFTAPIETWGTPLPAITGIVHYTSCLMPEFENHLLVSDNDNGYIYNITLGNAPAYDVVTSRVQAFDLLGLTTLHQGADGYLYALNGGYAPNGRLYKIGPSNPPGNPSANIIIGIVPNEVCLGDSFMVMANEDPSNLTYEFTLSGPNSTETITSTTATAYITPTETGPHDLSLVTSNGCITASAQAASYLTVYPQPTYTLNTVNASGGPNGSAWLSNYANVTSIVWLDANNQSLSSNDSINNLPAGTYSVVVSNGGVTNTCQTTESFTIDIGGSVSEFAASKINMYPNPANSSLFIDLNKLNNKVTTAQVFNSTGALVMTQPVNGKNLIEIDVNALPTGIYSVLLSNGKRSYAARWIKN